MSVVAALSGCAYYPAAPLDDGGQDGLRPGEQEAPLIGIHKLLFLIDVDPSLSTTDLGSCYRCEPFRIRAIREVIDRHLADPGVSFAIGVMGKNPFLATFVDQNGDGVEDQAFLRDRGQLEMGLTHLRNLDGEADLQSALELAWGLLQWEAPEPGVDPEPPVSYHVILLLAGNPVDADDELWRNTPEAILEATLQLVQVADAVPSFSIVVHTTLLSTGLSSGERQQAVDLLSSMTEIGGGELREFPDAADLDFTGL